ncbi:MAG TPA: glycosyl hydrolase, partial [Ktedonobacterales bacterium]
MQFIKRQVIRFFRFLKGETVTNERGQIKRFAVILGLAMLLGLTLSPIALVFTRSARPGEGTPLVQATATITKPTAAPTKIVATGPVKGLTDNPAYQWWRWPNQAQPDSWWGDGQNAQTLGQQISLMQELGVKVFREELVWSFVAPTMPGGSAYDSAQARDPNWSGYQWSRFDLIVQLTSQAGIQLVPEVVYSPDWASGITATTNGGPNAPPTAAQYFGDFVFAAATRYKGKIHYWEMWNEPDYAAHTWNGTAQQYVDLVLKPGYQSVKQVDPTAQVLIGGLAGDTNMQKFYTAGAQPYFDIGNVHTYYGAAAGDATGVTHVRGVMNQNGDTAKPLWLTEFGWSSAQDASV